ncbi:unnamed protein product [Rotaria sp. Silwood2]|nr:unnamed protein product [Rotaria sp. Silwood2]CAF4665519.1 unnamed protein product [Rotaria sp. Silwood2]
MLDVLQYRYSTYDSSKPAAGILAAIMGISLIGWIVQSVQIHFRPRRPLILILIANITLFIELILRAAFSTKTNNSKAAYTALTVLLAVSIRMVMLSNFDFLTQVDKLKPWITRAIILGSIFLGITSTVLMIPAGVLAGDPDTLNTALQLKQASSGIVLGMTVLFYPIWFATKTIKKMTKQAIILLIISSLSSLIVSVYLMITSVPKPYAESNKKEFWVYIFQITPNIIALLTWTILHPKRTLKPAEPPTESPTELKKGSSKEEVKTDIDDDVQILRF